MRGRKSDDDDVSRRALQSIARDAGRARMGDRVPPGKRPRGFMISIGVDDPDSEDHEFVKDGDPADVPSNGAKLPPEDLEVYGEADDDDEELPGRRRR